MSKSFELSTRICCSQYLLTFICWLKDINWKYIYITKYIFHLSTLHTYTKLTELITYRFKFWTKAKARHKAICASKFPLYTITAWHCRRNDDIRIFGSFNRNVCPCCTKDFIKFVERCGMIHDNIFFYHAEGAP